MELQSAISNKKVSVNFNKDGGLLVGLQGTSILISSSDAILFAQEILRRNNIETVAPVNFMDLSVTMENNICGAIDPLGRFRLDTSGYGLEIYPEARQIVNSPTAAAIKKFVDCNMRLFTNCPELRLGWDNYGEELNIGVRASSAYCALRVAGKLDQRAVYDIKLKKELVVAGAGRTTLFPYYSLVDRLKELDIKVTEGLIKALALEGKA